MPTTKMSLVPTETPPIWKAWPVIQLALLVGVLSGPNLTSIAPLDDKGHADGGDQRRQPGRVAQPAVGDPLDGHAGQAGGDHREREEDHQRQQQAPEAAGGQ